MSLTRRSLLGALAALVAAPAAAILARKPARDAFGGPPTGAHFDAVIFDDIETEPSRLHPVGTKVLQAFYIDARAVDLGKVDTIVEAKAAGRRALLRWADEHGCRLVGDVFFEDRRRDRGFIAACGRFVQE